MVSCSGVVMCYDVRAWRVQYREVREMWYAQPSVVRIYELRAAWLLVLVLLVIVMVVVIMIVMALVIVTVLALVLVLTLVLMMVLMMALVVLGG